MMHVYRIEHFRHGTGPYIQGSMVIADAHYFGSKCPGPIDDGVSFYGMAREAFFGFANLKAMVRWFKFRDILKMKKEGFRVYRYRVDESYVSLGDRQLAFAKAKAYSRVEVRSSTLLRAALFSS
jgi:hypothetical protein